VNGNYVVNYENCLTQLYDAQKNALLQNSEDLFHKIIRNLLEELLKWHDTGGSVKGKNVCTSRVVCDV